MDSWLAERTLRPNISVRAARSLSSHGVWIGLLIAISACTVHRSLGADIVDAELDAQVHEIPDAGAGRCLRPAVSQLFRRALCACSHVTLGGAFAPTSSMPGAGCDRRDTLPESRAPFRRKVYIARGVTLSGSGTQYVGKTPSPNAAVGCNASLEAAGAGRVVVNVRATLRLERLRKHRAPYGNCADVDEAMHSVTSPAAMSSNYSISLRDIDATATRVRVQSGWLQGSVSGATRTFLGVPYAKPPLGALRFRPPQPPDGWEGTRDANADGHECPYNGSLDMSEDCLTLNVFAPTTLPRGPVPVMVWIHGGGFQLLSKNLFRSLPAAPDGTQGLVEAGNVILVAINYRLGALAQFVHPQLDQELAAPSGNLSIRDQQAALRWVHENIGAFGGDPTRVTVFGQSGGGAASCMLMFAARDLELAQRYVVQSGGCVAGALSATDRARALTSSQIIVDKLCAGAVDPIACLRAAPFEGFVSDKLINWVPYIDGVLFEAPLLELAARPGWLRAPLIVGSTQNEARTMVLFGLPVISTLAELHDTLEHPGTYDFAHDAAERAAVLAHYHPMSDADANSTLQAIMNDEMFHCPARVLARAAAAAGVAVHLYSFEIPPAGHQQEVDYIFGYPLTSLVFPGEAPLPLLDAPLHAMQTAWTTFAWSGRPSLPPGLDWPAYDAASDQHVRFADEISVGQGLERDDCAFWDEIYTKRHTH